MIACVLACISFVRHCLELRVEQSLLASSMYPELFKLPSFVMLRDDGAHGLAAMKLSLGIRTII